MAKISFLSELKKSYPYNFETYALMLKKNGYMFVSFREKSTPTSGSPTFNLEMFLKQLRSDVKKATVNKVSVSRNGKKVTCVTKFGYFQFINPY